MKEFSLCDDLEKVAGPLSPLQRVLLGTDGSVTRLLELACGAPVAIVTRLQEVIPADDEVAERLQIHPGDEVNHRIVELVDTRSGETLIYAESYTPLSRLSPSFRDDLMRADIPIGKILEHHRLETRREIMGVSAGPRSPEVAKAFGLGGNPLFLSRRYRIIHRDLPLMHIEETFPASRFSGERHVVVRAPSRIHLGLLDMNGSLGRVDGGIGIALAEPGIVLSARRGSGFSVTGGDADAQHRVLAAARAVATALKLPGGAEFTLRSIYPGHVGLGRGTQLALSAATALCTLYHQACTPREAARMTGRGGTSGIGTAAFALGGFICDGGHSLGDGGDKSAFLPSSASRGVRPPEVTVRHPFPEGWKIILAIPRAAGGASGNVERDVFASHCPVPLEEVRELSHIVLVALLPALVEGDIELFGRAVERMQDLGFKRVENMLAPPVTRELREAMRDAGAAGAGLSSFGPTVFGFAEGDAGEIERACREVLDRAGGGETICTRACNTGAQVTVT
ncbi:MAG: beta-ribofuranosylaminobenzene 5'-phosphate synthase [Methanolinea sp.]|nr:beta-ribofuranosylaminobenzene 5'-phosphate synthase [Methanolinea sp.]